MLCVRSMTSSSAVMSAPMATAWAPSSAFAAALRQLGKRVTCVLVKDEPIEENLLQLLPGAADMVPACEYDGPVGLSSAWTFPRATASDRRRAAFSIVR